MSEMLQGSGAIVTGGGQGIGRGIALQFAREGARVAVIDIDEAAAGKVADEIRNDGGSATAFGCDVGIRQDVNQTVDAAAVALGSIDVLVNAAISGCPRIPLLETREEDVDRLWRSGLLGTLFFMQACHPHLAGRNCTIVNFASGAGLNGDIGYAAYGPVKEGIRSLTKVAARELGVDGIRVNAVFPAARTRLMDEWITDDPEGAASVEAMIPLGRFGDPEVDIPLAVVFLASDYSRYVTGHTLCVDGGSCKF